MRDYDWNLVKSFLAVIEHGTLIAAAAALRISQPTLGRQITELELATGLTLFDRGRGGMRPTDAALLLVSEAKDMQREADAFALLATARDETPSGTVRITASQIVTNFVLPQITTNFRKVEPAIEIELVASNKVQNLLARDADIAVRMIRPTQNDTIARKANDFEMGGYAHKDYLARQGTPVKPDELRFHSLIGYDRDDLIIRGMAEAGIQTNRGSFSVRTDDQVAYWHLLCAGAGIGFAPRYLAKRNPDLVRLFADMQIPSLPMWLVSHRELKSNLRIRRTMDYFYEETRALDLS